MEFRKRVELAINHKQTDRVPVNYWATEDVSRNLCKRFKLKYVNNAYLFGTGPGPESLLKTLGIDIRVIQPVYVGPQRKLPNGTPLSSWGTPMNEIAGTMVTSTYSNVLHRPLADITKPSQLDKYQWPDTKWWDYSTIEEQIENYSEYGLVVWLDGALFCKACELFGMEHFLLMLYKNSDLAHAVIERIKNFFLCSIKNILENGGNKGDIGFVWDDVAHKDGLFMNLDIWRKYFKPHLKEIYGLIKKNGVKIMMHTCGAMRPLIPEYIEVGLDILDPINVQASGMDPTTLKKDFGKVLSFHGAIDVQSTLPFGKPEEVRKEVCNRISNLGDGGGYILTSSHSMLSDIPVENIIAMYSEAGSLVKRTR